MAECSREWSYVPARVDGRFGVNGAARHTPSVPVRARPDRHAGTRYLRATRRDCGGASFELLTRPRPEITLDHPANFPRRSSPGVLNPLSRHPRFTPAAHPRRPGIPSAALGALLALVLLAWSVPGAGAASPYLEGIDVSHWQGPIDWPKVAAAGKKFVVMKATESTAFVDPTYATNHAGASAAGGGMLTSQSAWVSATTSSPANASTSARPSWPPAPVTKTLRLRPGWTGSVIACSRDASRADRSKQSRARRDQPGRTPL